MRHEDVTNLFGSKEKRRIFDLIVSAGDMELSEAANAELTQFLLSEIDYKAVRFALDTMTAYRSALLPKSLDAVLSRIGFGEQFNDMDMSFLLNECASISEYAHFAEKALNWVESGQLRSRPLVLMIDRMIEECRSGFLLPAYDSGLMLAIGMSQQSLIAKAYKCSNYLFSSVLESKGVHLEGDDYQNAEWYTHFGVSDDSQLRWLSMAKRFFFTVEDLRLTLNEHGGVNPLSSKLNLTPKFCFLSLCAADYFYSKCGLDRVYFNDEVGMVTVDKDYDGEIKYENLLISLAGKEVKLVSDENYLFELFATRLFMHSLLVEGGGFAPSLVERYEDGFYKSFGGDNTGREQLVLLLTGVLETLKGTDHHKCVLDSLLLMLEASERVCALEDKQVELMPIGIEECLIADITGRPLALSK
jgi:hypothetical protein